MKLRKVFGLLGATLLLIGMSGNAHALQFTFDSVGDTETATYSLSVDGANLAASITWQLTALSATSATLKVTVNNTSTGTGTNRLVSFGVDVVNPDLTSASADNGWSATLDTTLPGFGQVDLCVWDGSNCAGGASGGVTPSSSEMINVTLGGDFSGGTITFDSPLPTKWQSVGANLGSYEFDCVECNGDGDEDVPAPATLALLGLGLAGFGVARRRRLR